jgi:hypothetical protein
MTKNTVFNSLIEGPGDDQVLPPSSAILPPDLNLYRHAASFIIIIRGRLATDRKGKNSPRRKLGLARRHAGR